MRQLDDVILWLWDAHNQVNARLRRTPQNTDPYYPKVQWPTPSLCPTCRATVESVFDNDDDPLWNRTAVVQFMLNHYGQFNGNEVRSTETRTEQTIVDTTTSRAQRIDATVRSSAGMNGYTHTISILVCSVFVLQRLLFEMI